MTSAAESMNNCCIRLNHIPYGFFEKELYGYFTQFGRVVRVRVPKSKRGLFKNKAYILFDDKEVARLASETMDNYLMFDKRVRCSVIKDRVPNVINTGPTFAYHEGVEKTKHQEALHNARERTTEETKLEKIKIAKGLRSALKKLKENGYDYEFDYSQKEKQAFQS